MPKRHVELLLVSAILVAAAAWMDFSTLHRFTNADSLMMTLVSLYKWTPMFWEQNRLGMLVPALAMPFRHPLDNMLVQGGLTTLSGLGSFFLLGCYVAGRRRGLTIGALSALLFVGTIVAWQRYCYFIYIYQFHVSFSLALLGLLALARWQRSRRPWEPPIAVACLWLAMWVNPTLVFAVVPLILLRRLLLGDAAAEFDRMDAMPTARSSARELLEPPEPAAQARDIGTRCPLLGRIMQLLSVSGATARESRSTAHGSGKPPYVGWLSRAVSLFPRCWPNNDAVPRAPCLLPPLRIPWFPAADWLALAATASGLLVSMAISKFAADSQEQYSFLPPREWLACVLGVLKDLTHQLHVRWFLAVTTVAATGLLTLLWPRGRKAFRVSSGIALGLLIPAAVQLGFVTSVDHVHRTDFGHYAFAAAFLWQGALLTFAVLQWAAVLPDRPATRRVPWVLLALFMTVVVSRHGRPGVGVVRAALQESIGKYSPEVLSSGCTHVVGDFWHVWPTMFYANLMLADQGEPARVWGLAFRCQPTSDQWARVPSVDTRIAEILGDEPHTLSTLKAYGLPPLALDRELTTIRVMRPTLPLSASLPVQRTR